MRIRVYVQASDKNGGAGNRGALFSSAGKRVASQVIRQSTTIVLIPFPSQPETWNEFPTRDQVRLH